MADAQPQRGVSIATVGLIVVVALVGGVGIGVAGKSLIVSEQSATAALDPMQDSVGHPEPYEVVDPEPVDGGRPSGSPAPEQPQGTGSVPPGKAPPQAPVSCETLPRGSSELLWTGTSSGEGVPAGFEEARPASAAGCRTRIAFHKTHKTGSATIAGSVFQSSLCSKCTMYDQPKSGGVLRMPPADWMLSEMAAWPNNGSSERLMLHTSGTGADAIGPWSKQTRWIVGDGGGPQAMVPGGAIVTSLREPVSRWLSHQLYFEEPAVATTKGKEHRPAEFLLRAAQVCSASNIMAREFGLQSEADVRAFLERDLPRFGGLVLLDDLERTLTLTALRLRLRPEDVLYFTINSSREKQGWMTSAKGLAPLSKPMQDLTESQQPGTPGVGVDSSEVATAGEGPGWNLTLPLRIATYRWDYLRVLRTPRVSSLGPDLAAKIRECNALDEMLYEGARRQVERWAEMAAADGGRMRLDENVERLRAAVEAVTTAVRERLESGTDRRPAMSNVRTFPDSQWMGMEGTISLSGLMTLNELDRNGFVVAATRAVLLGRDPKAAATYAPGAVSDDLLVKASSAYEKVCELRDSIVAAATGGEDPRGGPLGFVCDAA